MCGSVVKLSDNDRNGGRGPQRRSYRPLSRFKNGEVGVEVEVEALVDLVAVLDDVACDARPQLLSECLDLDQCQIKGFGGIVLAQGGGGVSFIVVHLGL